MAATEHINSNMQGIPGKGTVSRDSVERLLGCEPPQATPKACELTDPAAIKQTASPAAPSTPLQSPTPTHRSCSSSSLFDEQQQQQQQPELTTVALGATPDLDKARDVLQGKKVLITVSAEFIIKSGGTRGDVQPATALGVALSGLGARVCLAADSAFEGFVTEHGLSYFPLGGDAKEMMAVTVKWGGMLPNEFSGMGFLRSQIRDVMDSVWAAAEAWQPDILLANQLAYGQVHVAEKLGIPLHMIYTIPWLPTTAIAHPWARAWGANITEYITAAAAACLAPVCWLVGRFSVSLSSRVQQGVMGRVAAAANWTSTPLLDHTAWWGIADLMTAFRYKLGLPLLSANNTGLALYKAPTLCMFSSALVPRPADWGSHISMSGFLSISEAVERFGIGSSCNSDSSGDDSSSSGGGAGSSSGRSSDIDDLNAVICDQRDNNSISNQLVLERLLLSHSNSSNNLESSDCDDYERVASGTTLSLSSNSSSSCAAAHSSSSSSGTTAHSSNSNSSGATAHSSWKPSVELLQFLASGPPPIYIGFGSMVVQDPQQLLTAVLDAVLQLPSEQRVILCTGWAAGADVALGTAADTAGSSSSGSDGGSGSRRVFCLREAPHEWLFPRCSALVHHGGVGTTAVGLRCGKPTLVVPAFGDLFFWGEVCHKMGVGPAPLPLDHLTGSSLLAALTQLMTHHDAYRIAAEHITAQLNCEDGLAAAVAAVANVLAGGSKAM